MGSASLGLGVDGYQTNGYNAHRQLFACPSLERRIAVQLRFSKLRTFNECALKYRFAYVERLPRPPLKSLQFQRKLHGALAFYHRFAKRDGIVRLDDLL